MEYRANRATSHEDTEQTRSWTKALPGVFMLLVLAGGLLLALLTPATFNLPDESVLDGEWATTYQTNFEQALALREPSVTFWGGLSYVLFKEGRPGVLVGADGWLFTSEEFERYSAETLQENLETIATVRDTLASRDIELVIALVPAKARVYEEQLGRYGLPNYTAERYEVLRETLEGQGIPVANLLPALLDAKTESDVFLQADTHWTPYGAQVAAEAVAQTVQEQAPFAELGETDFEVASEPPESHQGDLLTFLPLGYLEERIGPGAEGLEPFSAEQVGGGGGDLFGDPNVPVTLVGTSYSADPKWNFADALKVALGADVLNAAEEGEGPFLPMIEYLNSETLQNTVPELVVWEIPERYSAVSYDLPAIETSR